jgi:DNA-binding GntR family transcriptional regulator
MSDTLLDVTKPPRAADGAERAYLAIRQQAMDYVLRPGERLNEVEIAGELGVSRTPVRAALNRLVADGFLRAVPNKGFFARELDEHEVMDLYELREALEVLAFRLACERAAQSDLEQLAAGWKQQAEKLDPVNLDAHIVVDEWLHMEIARLGENRELQRQLAGINTRIRFFRRIDLENPGRPEHSNEEHRALIKALLERQPDGFRIMHMHIRKSSAQALAITKEALARIYLGNRR